MSNRWQGVLLGGGALLVLSGAALLFGSGMAAGQAGTSLSFAPAAQNIATGSGDFEININVSNVQNLGAYELTVIFDPNIIEYAGSSDNGYLASTGRQQSCFGFGLGPDQVNGYKALHVGCATNGLISGGQGNPGPDGSGTLATVIFRPKNTGAANIVFEGLGNDAYYVGAPDPELPAGAVEVGHTSLAFVEVCNPGCSEQDIPFGYGTGAVTVYQQGQATPTALPRTPTPEPPDDVSESDFRKTVAAAVGTPALLGTQDAGQTGTTTGTDGSGTGTSGGSGSGSGAASGGGAVAGSGNGSSGAGTSGGAVGPDGAPIAGYGMEKSSPNPLWTWSGVGLLCVGALIMAWGAAVRRRGMPDM